nr:methyltransferase domain-containing protein [Mycolicibacterium chubuense]
MADTIPDIARMPRGGPGASWLDRTLQTDRLEYLDRNDVDELKDRVVRALDRGGRRRHGIYGKCAQVALDVVADVPRPKILELGAGLGGLSEQLLRHRPDAEVTITDLDPAFVDEIARSDLGRHPRAIIRTMDATAIDAPDGGFDLAVFALSLHHLPPASAARVFAEGTRVARKLLIIDLRRPPAPLHAVVLAAVMPFTPVIPLTHDGVISSMRAYSPAALKALARHAAAEIEVEFRTRRFGPTVVVAARRSEAAA